MSEDPIQVAPEYYRVVFENERVRVLAFHAGPGASWVLHAHPDAVVVSLNDYRVRNVVPGAEPTVREARWGDVAWIPARSHTGENVGDSEMDCVLIELKEPARGASGADLASGTLDGGSPDYRYLQVRRTLIYIEQSIKVALEPFAFAPNDGNTWATVVSTVSSFLEGVWSQGGLLGATASEGFSILCGLGSTMTGQDILEGYMRLQVLLQMIRPAEYIELVFEQKMGSAG